MKNLTYKNIDYFVVIILILAYINNFIFYLGIILIIVGLINYLLYKNYKVKLEESEIIKDITNQKLNKDQVKKEIDKTWDDINQTFIFDYKKIKYLRKKNDLMFDVLMKKKNWENNRLKIKS